jgi:hypothetical protein
MTDALTRREDRLFRALVDDPQGTFKNKLYRDGLPRPDIYTKQKVRVVFVFREPNLPDPVDLDMRAQVRDPEFRGFCRGEYWLPATNRGWWNGKVGRYGHAVVGALAGFSATKGCTEFEALLDRHERAHKFLFPFGFMQIKKVGGGGRSKSQEIAAHARDYADVLHCQLALYQPHIVIACGLGGRSPAKLLRKYVLTNDADELRTSDGRFRWWRFRGDVRPAALLEFLHPSSFRSGQERYLALASAVRDIMKGARLRR